MSNPTISFPALQVRMVKRERVVANNYNPNHVSHDKMELLRQSIIDNGFCYPIITIYDADRDIYVIIDGFHRWTICQPDCLDLPEIPIVVLEHDISQRMFATIQFNKARGHHQVDLDAEMVRSLIEQGISEEEIAARLKIEEDTVHRYKAMTGILSLFEKANYSMSWEMQEVAND